MIIKFKCLTSNDHEWYEPNKVYESVFNDETLDELVVEIMSNKPLQNCVIIKKADGEYYTVSGINGVNYRGLTASFKLINSEEDMGEQFKAGQRVYCVDLSEGIRLVTLEESTLVEDKLHDGNRLYNTYGVCSYDELPSLLPATDEMYAHLVAIFGEHNVPIPHPNYGAIMQHLLDIHNKHVAYVSDISLTTAIENKFTALVTGRRNGVWESGDIMTWEHAVPCTVTGEIITNV